MIPLTVHVRSSYGTSTIEWSNLYTVKVAVRIDRARHEYGAEYTWRVNDDAAVEVQSAVAKLQAEHGDKRGPIVLSVIEGQKPEETNLLVVAARDALARVSHLRYSESLTAYAQARELSDRGDQLGAIEADRIGVEALGDLYSSPDLVDDTETKLMMAEDALEGNRTAEAAALLERVLESRLTEYRSLRAPTPSPGSHR